jgi:hypothetical protein
LPAQHRYIWLHPIPHAASGISDLAFALVSDEEISDGERRVAAAQIGAGYEALYCRSFPDVLPEEEVVKILSRLFGDNLVSVASHLQSRSFTESGPLHIGPAKLLWPANSRLQVEPLRMQGEYLAASHSPGPAAIQQHVVSEEPPRVHLRLHFNTSLGLTDLLLNRFVLVHAMHQRRFFERQTQQRQQHGRAHVEALSLETIRGWLNDIELYFEAAETKESILVANLASEIAAVDQRRPEIRITVAKDDSYVDVEFICAALGDDVGIASSFAIDGDVTVRPTDPGGDPRVRLFRVGEEWLEPLRLEGREEIFRTILSGVAKEEQLVARPSPSGDSRRHWATFLERLGLSAALDALKLWSNPIGALLLAAWAEIAKERRDDSTRALTDFQQFRRVPALVSAAKRIFGPEHQGINFEAAAGEVGLPRQIAAALGGADLVPSTASMPGWENLWQVVASTDIAPKLIEARISLDGSSGNLADIAATATELHEEQRAKTALECSLDRGRSQDAAALQEYLDRRRNALWSTFASVKNLPALLQELLGDTIAPEVPATLDGSDDRDYASILRSVELMLGKATGTASLDSSVKATAREFESRKKQNKLDRRVLRQFEQKLTKLLGLPDIDRMADEITEALEAWAGLPHFAAQMKPRLRRVLGDGPRPKRDIVEAVVNRVRLPRAERFGRDFDRRRQELALRIQEKFSKDRSAASESRNLAKDIAEYGDILLHHRAWMAMARLAERCETQSPAPDALPQLRKQMRTWPLRASVTWDEAKQLAMTCADLEREEFANALTAPELPARVSLL